MITSPPTGASLSGPVHLVQVLCFPCASLGSARPVILAKILPPCSYTSTSERTLPVLSSIVFHFPTGDSAAAAVVATRRKEKSRAATVFHVRVRVMVCLLGGTGLEPGGRASLCGCLADDLDHAPRPQHGGLVRHAGLETVHVVPDLHQVRDRPDGNALDGQDDVAAEHDLLAADSGEGV